jgi:hypothetical protein
VVVVVGSAAALVGGVAGGNVGFCTVVSTFFCTTGASTGFAGAAGSGLTSGSTGFTTGVDVVAGATVVGFAAVVDVDVEDCADDVVATGSFFGAVVVDLVVDVDVVAVAAAGFAASFAACTFGATTGLLLSTGLTGDACSRSVATATPAKPSTASSSALVNSDEPYHAMTSNKSSSSAPNGANFPARFDAFIGVLKVCCDRGARASRAHSMILSRSSRSNGGSNSANALNRPLPSVHADDADSDSTLTTSSSFVGDELPALPGDLLSGQSSNTDYSVLSASRRMYDYSAQQEVKGTNRR